MSVVNKMLRDLDQRRVGQLVSSTEPTLGYPEIGKAVPHGTQSVQMDDSGVPKARLALRTVAAAAVCVVVGAVAWHWSHKTSASPERAASLLPAAVQTGSSAYASPSAPAQPIAAAVQPTPPPKPAVHASATAPISPPVVETEPGPLVLSTGRTADLAPKPVQQAAQTRSLAAAGAAPAVSLRMDSTLTLRQPVVTSPAATPSSKVTRQAFEPTPTLQRQQLASADALSQAQTLWSAGSHAAAIDLMQQAIDAAERSVKAGSSAPGNSVLLSLVREWSRMQMVEERYGLVWDLLSRLEPVLGNAPDLWGLRGNTAQRLGRHADSVHAYTMALQSRPNEQRWILGAAVSMAALGQTDQAAAMVAKAQAVGEIGRDVQAYLRQMGVPVKAR